MVSWDEPIRLRDVRVRRVYARELVVQLRRWGAATVPEMLDARFRLMLVPATEAELRQVVDVAERLGWIEPKPVEGEAEPRWAVTDAGADVRPNDSLVITQVLGRMTQLAEPVKGRVTDWLPLLALVAGAVAAQQADGKADDGALLGVRIASVAVLVISLVIGGIGEVRLLRAAKARPEKRREPWTAYARFYSEARLWMVAVFDALVVAAFGVTIFAVGYLEWWQPVTLAVALAFMGWCLRRFWAWEASVPAGPP